MINLQQLQSLNDPTKLDWMARELGQTVPHMPGTAEALSAQGDSQLALLGAAPQVPYAPTPQVPLAPQAQPAPAPQGGMDPMMALQALQMLQQAQPAPPPPAPANIVGGAAPSQVTTMQSAGGGIPPSLAQLLQGGF